VSDPRPKILAVDDTPVNLKLFEAILAPRGYDVITASSGREALEKVRTEKPDLVLSDIVMPGMNGYELCKKLREDESTRFLPVVMITASGDQERIQALEAGADDFMTKPPDQVELLTRVRSLIRIKQYHDTIERQRGELRRFISPQVADLITSAEGEALLKGHRREITVLFCDLRGFTAFSETAEPEEAIAVVRAYHGTIGPLIVEHGGTLEHFEGDGFMVFFNDPVAIDAPVLQAVKLAVAIRDRMADLCAQWRKRGYELGVGCGIATGYATLGRIGFEGRYDYGAIGQVTNLGARLSSEAKAGQILLSQRAFAAVEDDVEVAPVGELTVKGYSRPQPAYDVLRLKERVATRA
jgi:class 3 adenylate cyclase